MCCSQIRTVAHLCPIIYNVGRWEVRHMKKTRIRLNEAEWRLLLYALNELKTELISEGRYTDVVDEVMMKIIKAPIRKVKIA